jgi:hypothetical protein
MPSRSRADLSRLLDGHAVNVTVMARRQQQTAFKVFNAHLEFDAPACASMTGLIEDIRGRHGPSWA